MTPKIIDQENKIDYKNMSYCPSCGRYTNLNSQNICDDCWKLVNDISTPENDRIWIKSFLNDY